MMIWLVDRLLGFAAAVLVTALVVVLVIRARHRRLARQRAGEGWDGFARYFAGRSVPADVAETAYRKLQAWTGEPAFPVRPADEVTLYGLGFEHFDEFLDDLVRSTGRRASERIIAAATVRVRTVEDIVLFVASCPAA